MVRSRLLVLFIPVWLLIPQTAAPAGAVVPTVSIDSLYEPVAGWSCKQASSCAEAVRAWCGGYRRADGDSDGIPCENVCRSRAEVNHIRKQIGC